MVEAVNALPGFEPQASAKTGTDDAIGSDNYIKNDTIRPALDRKMEHKVAQSPLRSMISMASLQGQKSLIVK